MAAAKSEDPFKETLAALIASSTKVSRGKAVKAQAAGAKGASAKSKVKAAIAGSPTRAAAPKPKPPARAGGWAVAGDPKRTVNARNESLLGLTNSICENRPAMQGALKLIADRSAPIEVRLTALSVVQAATFSGPRFNPWRPDYLATLRGAAQDPDFELRQRVLGILAREQDGSTQQQLLAGLKDPAQALLPPEKALQLLSYDVHAEAYPVARELVQNPPNEAAKREALRVLGADASSAPIFESLLRDKSQPADVRQISASALHSLAPEKLQSNAREILLDPTDDDAIRATSLTALAHFGGAQADTDVLAEAHKLRAATESDPLTQSAQQYLQTFQR